MFASEKCLCIEDLNASRILMILLFIYLGEGERGGGLH